MIPIRLPAQKARKYRNEPIVVDGVRFDSTREAIRFHTLRLLERSGDIKNLQRQVRFPLKAGNEIIGYYVADYTYFDNATRTEIVEDLKGFATALFQWKAKHFQAQYGRKIRVTK